MGSAFRAKNNKTKPISVLCPTPKKKSYSDIRLANKKITELIILDKTNVGARAYLCRCDKWHLTSTWDDQELRKRWEIVTSTITS